MYLSRSGINEAVHSFITLAHFSTSLTVSTLMQIISLFMASAWYLIEGVCHNSLAQSPIEGGLCLQFSKAASRAAVNI